MIHCVAARGKGLAIKASGRIIRPLTGTAVTDLMRRLIEPVPGAFCRANNRHRQVVARDDTKSYPQS